MTREIARRIIDDLDCYLLNHTNDYSECSHEAMMMAIKALEQEPKTGRWVKHDTGYNIYYDCSLCGCVAPCTETADKILWKLSNYCPDCGTKMKKEEK